MSDKFYAQIIRKQYGHRKNDNDEVNKNLSEVIAYKARYGTILSWNYGLAHIIHFGCLHNPISDT